MKETDFEIVRHRMLLALFFLSVGTFVLAFFIGVPRPALEEPKFKIVDKYNKCDVIRYTTSFNEWKYFLDCQASQSSPRQGV